MQKRYWNYKDDDYTLDMNHRDFPFRPHGRYAGFDRVSHSGLTLTLSPSITGIEKIPLIAGGKAPVSVWVTRQGVTITEDENMTIPFTANNDVVPRIDIIVGNHRYEELEGGVVATYGVVEGSADANPVAPDVTNDNVEVILAEILIPAGAQNLDEAVYKPRTVPNFGNDDTILHSERPQMISTRQEFKTLDLKAYDGLAEYDRANTKIILPTYVGEDDERYLYSKYLVKDPNNIQAYGTVATIEDDQGVRVPAGVRLSLFIYDQLILPSDFPAYVSGQWVDMEYDTFGALKLFGDVRAARVSTKYRALQRGNSIDAKVDGSGNIKPFGLYLGNLWKVTDDDAGGTVLAMRTENWELLDTSTYKSSNSGTIVVVENKTGASLTIVHDDDGADVNNKEFWCPDNQDYVLPIEGLMFCIETSTHWKILGGNGGVAVDPTERTKANVASMVGENSWSMNNPMAVKVGSHVTFRAEIDGVYAFQSPMGAHAMRVGSIPEAFAPVLSNSMQAWTVVADMNGSGQVFEVSVGIGGGVVITKPVNASWPNTTLRFRFSLSYDLGY